MMLWHNAQLRSQLLVSYLLIVAVASATFYVVSEALAPAFLDWHLTSMSSQTPTSSSDSDALFMELRAAHARSMQQALFWSVLTSLLTASALSLVVAGRIAAPLRAMQQASSRIAKGHYHERLKPPLGNEIGKLAEAFNEMALTLEETETRRLELLANVAHEFRTPLSSLNGYLEGIEDGYFSSDADTLAACHRQIDRLRRLTDDLALLSRVEAGQETVYPGPIDALRLLDLVADSFRPQCAAKGVSLTIEVPRHLELLADEQRTLQIISNLMSNALRHTPTGGEIRLTAAPSGQYVLFQIVDTGEGIAVEAQPHVFTRFFKSRGEGDGGSGIGLTIAKHFVDVQGGRIGLESEVGKGTRFWFTLPAVA